MLMSNKDFYLLRSPLLPINALDHLLHIPYQQLAAEIKELFSSALLAEAIYIASPELSRELIKWQQGQLTGEKEIEKLVLSLFRYMLRMSYRCTPYGLFAGCSTGSFNNSTDVQIAVPEQHQKHCRLDMNYVAELADVIGRLPDVQEQLKYFPNNSLYPVGDTYRYASYTIKNKFRQYDLTSVNRSVYLEKVLTHAAAGATINQLCSSITDEEISYEEAKEFIAELIESQLLISELAPTVTGEEFFKVLTGKLKDITPAADILLSIQQLLTKPAAGIDKYLQTHALVKKLLPDTNTKDLVQTDLFLSAPSNTISQHVADELAEQASHLWKLSSVNNNPDLQQFISRFRDRYEEQEIPLVIALDTETGIGYGSHTGHSATHAPLVDEIFIPNNQEPDTISWNKLRSFQLELLGRHQAEIELTDKDLDTFNPSAQPNIPDSLYLMGSLVAKSAEDIDNGQYLFDLSSCGGPSAANLLGRFCHGDNFLKEKVQECLEEEAQHSPEDIYAEIVHLPESRTGNILMRPQLRQYEIVYLGKGSVPAEQQIPVSDLMISIRQNTVILRSKKLNKRIIPRLSTAHNFTTGSLPVYKFLCDLQFQQLHNATGWHWNLPVEQPFLPRVRYGKIILSKSTWTLTKKDKTPFAALCAQLNVPRYVAVTEGDNELFIDMKSESCLHLLESIWQKKEKIILQEVLQTPDNCWVEGASGRFTNELIIPLKSTSSRQTGMQLTAQHTTFLQRSFMPGSEWLYIKIYAGVTSNEKILTTVIRPLAEELLNEQVIDKWFFIRYNDPENHIRIRFHHGNNAGFWKTVTERLYALLDQHAILIHSIQIDTYVREIERYGTETMILSEDIFFYDSEATINCISLLEGEEAEHYRWLLAARGVDMLLQDFGYTLSQKAAFMKRVQKHFFEEFGAAPTLQTQLNSQYRKHMRQLAGFLDPLKDTANEIEEAVHLFNIRSAKISKALQQVSLAHSREELVSSYIHMFLNRILLSNQRKHELVIYHFLNKYYESQVAIQQQSATAKHPSKAGLSLQ